ncbi:methyltransferase [Rhizobium mongolense]|uniref:Glutamate-1-semialdehyde 2,1-aminomutase n=2 Tax=Rhizobium mongolense TaxID=57676 RepID=A0ABR6IXA5_9HYPH|nr:class I SAM-dependent methyltransferase [Rhizobium mongolense]MBB4232551.1 glutamate-1-semialdehyde 2,1-aminomutase [Rhizobium mongolense]TVZ75013.1 methyltransferase family protein [Rhizobium mongolense USDA 1844]
MNELNGIRTKLTASQHRTFPRQMREFGLDLIVRERVFPPEDFLSWRWICENFPAFAGKTILEIGCGFGLPGLWLAKTGALSVLASDINPSAVANTLENATRNDIRNVEVIESDIFSNIPHRRKFDIVFWNYPSNFAPEECEYVDDLERGAFDPGYNLLKRFLSEGPGFLTDKGYILLGFGTNARDDLLEQITADNDLTSLMLGSVTYPNGDVTYRLFSLFRRATSL